MLTRALIITMLIVLLVLSVMSNVALRQTNSSVKHAADKRISALDTASSQMQTSINNYRNEIGVADETNAALSTELAKALSSQLTCKADNSQLNDKLVSQSLLYEKSQGDLKTCQDDLKTCQSASSTCSKANSTCESKLADLTRPSTLYGSLTVENGFDLDVPKSETFTLDKDPDVDKDISEIAAQASKNMTKMASLRAAANTDACKPTHSTRFSTSIQCLEFVVSQLLNIPKANVKITGFSEMDQTFFDAMTYILGYYPRSSTLTDAEIISAWHTIAMGKMKDQKYGHIYYSAIVSSADTRMVEATMKNVSLADALLDEVASKQGKESLAAKLGGVYATSQDSGPPGAPIPSHSHLPHNSPSPHSTVVETFTRIGPESLSAYNH